MRPGALPTQIALLREKQQWVYFAIMKLEFQCNTGHHSHGHSYAPTSMITCLRAGMPLLRQSNLRLVMPRSPEFVLRYRFPSKKQS